MRKKHIAMAALVSGALLAPGLAPAEPGTTPSGEEMQRPAPTEQPSQDPGEFHDQMQQQAPKSDPRHLPDVSAPSDASASSQQYVVRKGDTLGSIAEKTLGSSDQWRQIARANGIDDPNSLKVGQRLRIPEKGMQPSPGDRQTQPKSGMQPNSGTQPHSGGNPGSGAGPDAGAGDGMTPTPAPR